MAAAALGLMLVGMLSATGVNSTAPVAQAAQAAVSHFSLASPSAPAPVRIRLADDLPDAPAAAPADSLQGPPERRLIGIYRLIAQHRLDEALKATEALTRSAPNFKLAQLVYADLLSARFAPLAGFGSGAAAPAASAPAELGLLRDEAMLRIKALQERPPEGALPDEFVLLPESVKFAVAVDTSRARLYLFQNGPQGPRLVDDYYVSVGKQGVDKLVEGDQKTPLGVYFITDRIDQRSLEDRFGAGALPLNYPNVYDRSLGRTGSGILVHGVPSNTYSRPPLDSDGCVALANEDLLKLSRQLPQRDTPVIITRSINWVVPGATRTAQAPGSERERFMSRIQQWQQARLAADRDSLQAMYGEPAPALQAAAQPTVASQPPSPAALQAQADIEAAARFRQRLSAPPGGIEDLSVLTWHDDKKNVMVVTFREVAPVRGQRDRIVRQYWGREGNDWRIVAEGPVR